MVATIATGKVFGYICPGEYVTPEQSEAAREQCRSALDAIRQGPNSANLNLTWAGMVRDAPEAQKVRRLERPRLAALDAILQPGDVVLFPKLTALPIQAILGWNSTPSRFASSRRSSGCETKGFPCGG